jgi:hypothetical protein
LEKLYYKKVLRNISESRNEGQIEACKKMTTNYINYLNQNKMFKKNPNMKNELIGDLNQKIFDKKIMLKII